MRSNHLTRTALLGGFAISLLTVTPGCGSGKPSDGTQFDVTIPQADAQKQNDAYKDYAKQTKKRPKP